MTSKKAIFDERFLDDAAAAIWASAKMHAQERKSGSSLNAKANTDRIRKELQGAAAIIAMEVAERQEPGKALRELAGKLRGELKVFKEMYATARREFAEANSALQASREALAVVKSQLANTKRASASATSPATIKPLSKQPVKKAVKKAVCKGLCDKVVKVNSSAGTCDGKMAPLDAIERAGARARERLGLCPDNIESEAPSD